MHRVTLLPVTVPPPNMRTYTVKAGDTLRGLANALLHNSAEYRRLAAINGLRTDTQLTPGQQIHY